MITLEKTKETPVEYDDGLRRYLSSVFSTLMFGIGLTAFLSYFIYAVPVLFTLAMNPVTLIVALILPFIFIFTAAAARKRNNMGLAYFSYYGLCACFGVTFSTVFIQYQLGSIVTVFAATVVMFAGLALYGYTTKRNLTAFGSLLYTALLGLIVVSLIGLFVHSTMYHMVITVAGVLIFSGLIAYDMQKIKSMYRADMTGQDMKFMVLDAALEFYLDFINLFLRLLELLGKKK